MENTTKTPLIDISSMFGTGVQRVRTNDNEYIVFAVRSAGGVKQIITTNHQLKAPLKQIQEGGYLSTHGSFPFAGDLWAGSPQSSLHQYALNLFAEKRELIDSLYVKDLLRLPLIYSIVLREDTFANRDTVYDVLIDLQESYDIDDVHFSFYPPSLKETLHDQTKIEL